MLSSAFRFDVPRVFPALPRWPKRLKSLGTRLIYCGKNTATIRWPPGRIKVGRWNERVRAKRCDAVDWDYAYKCRLFSTSVRACDVVCTLVTAAVTELWQLDLFPCTSSSFLCAGTLSPRGKCCYFFAGGLVGVDKHLFQRVSFITSMTLTLNYIFVLLLAKSRQCECYSKTKTTKYCLKHEGKSHPCHQWQN